ncbi:pantoate--beta-alanine ligase [Pseudactinotalea suaedae]|uniref:pantoate--beta-alanine ligase n=1 Tax=Pseudactinotalea suaedae TaxID=1524924 RepID=UPI003F4F9F14
MTSRPGRLGIGVVGAGRVGAVLAHVLRSAGHAVVGASGVSEASRDRVADLLPGVPVLEVEQVVERAELVLLTVPDDALAPLVAGLAQLGRFHEGQLVVHTAGRFGTDVLAPARDAGAIPLAIHPAMTFTGTSTDVARLVGAPFAVTADEAVLPIALALVVELGGEPVVLPEAARGRYHAALSHASNHLVTLIAQARGTLATIDGVDPAMLGPLAQASLDGAVHRGDAALTGPVSRGDAGTVSEHVEALAALQGQPDVLPAYRALARATAERAARTGRLSEPRARGVLSALDGHATRALTEPPRLVSTVADLRAALTPRRRAVVMTMGALHEGHLALVRGAAQRADEVVVTIFVNPLQFSAGEDLATYPRTLEADLARLTETGVVDLVFAPSVAEMYPDGEPLVTLDAGPMGEVLEGAARPGHFDGMLTVVNKLLHLTRPDVAMFGQKDAQQLALVRRMVADLDMDIEIVAEPIVREPDGLARSSRNTYLAPAERAAALALSRAMRAGSQAREGGPEAVLAAARAELDAADPLVEVDYLALVDPATLRPAPSERPTAATLLLVAARVGRTRLIDNAVIDYPGE